MTMPILACDLLHGMPSIQEATATAGSCAVLQTIGMPVPPTAV